MVTGVWRRKEIEIPWSRWLGIRREQHGWRVLWLEDGSGPTEQTVALSSRRARELEEAGSRALEQLSLPDGPPDGAYAIGPSALRKEVRSQALGAVLFLMGSLAILAFLATRILPPPAPPLPAWPGVLAFSIICAAQLALASVPFRHLTTLRRRARCARRWSRWRVRRGMITRTHTDGTTDRFPVDKLRLTGLEGGTTDEVELDLLAGDPVRRRFLLAQLDRSGRTIRMTSTQRDAAFRLLAFWPLLTAAATFALVDASRWPGVVILSGLPAVVGAFLWVHDRIQRRALARDLEHGRHLLPLTGGGAARHSLLPNREESLDRPRG